MSRSFAPSVTELLHRVRGLRSSVAADAAERRASLGPGGSRPGFGPSLDNLAAYLALRGHDLRGLQRQLNVWGLSSLGRAEARVMPTLAALERALSVLAGESAGPLSPPPSAREFVLADRLLLRATRRVLGPAPKDRRVHIMVTLDGPQCADPAYVRALCARGMNAARINCAHDEPAVWERAIANVRAASHELGVPCRVFMDLAGPKCRTGSILAEEGFRLSPGARFLLRRSTPDPAIAFPAQVECTLPSLVDALEVGHPVLIDDGKTNCEVEEVRPEGVVLRVSYGRDRGRRLREGKSLNAPRSAIRERAITDKDLCDLEFVAKHADVVQLSFVQERGDVEQLQRELAAHLGGRPMLPVVLKIETARAVRSFPDLVAQAGARQPVAAMIARGDLAVEIGFERLAEMQEELLCLAEAAHVPVIWATQVLERFVRKGLPTRAEISDVVLGGRAECVMLNKGPYQLEAVAILHDLLHRLGGHQWKRRPQLRALRSWAE